MIDPQSGKASDDIKPEENLALIPQEEKLSLNPEPKGKSPFAWRLILACFLIALTTGAVAKWWLTRNSQGNQMAIPNAQAQALPVKLETLESQLLEKSTTVVGVLEAPRAVTIKSEVSGRVNRILVKEGTRVKAGQTILILENDDLKAELFQAQAQLENAQARLAQLKSGNRPEDINFAKAQLDQAIARLEDAQQGAKPEEIAQAQARVDSAQAELDLAQERVNRYRNLEVEGAISEDQFAEYLKIERRAIASLTEAQRGLEAVSKGRDSDVNELSAAVEQARQNLKRLENGARIEEIAQAQANVAQAKAGVNMVEVKIKKTQIVAPFTGIVGDLPIKLGDYIDSGNSLTTITENNTLEVNLSIPLEQANELRLGLSVVILDSQGQNITTGEISFISPDVTPNTQLVLAKAALENSSGLLFNQGSVQAKIIWEQSTGVLVPASAISRLGGKSFVFVAQVGENSTPDQPQLIAKQTIVTLGALQGNNYQILEGLEVGDQIVTEGIMNLRDNVPILPLPSQPMN